MKCEQGDVAKIIFAINPKNVGKTVIVDSYIGHFSKREMFEFRGVECMAPVTDHYWWIEADFGLTNAYGDTPKAYIADTWLEPLRPKNTVVDTEQEVELETH